MTFSSFIRMRRAVGLPGGKIRMACAFCDEFGRLKHNLCTAFEAVHAMHGKTRAASGAGPSLGLLFQCTRL